MHIDAPTQAHIPALRQLWRQAFGDEEAFLDAFFSTAFSPDRCCCVFSENRPVAMLYWFDCSCRGKKLAYLYAIATEKTFRGQGLCRTLMDRVHRLLAEQGYTGTVLVPADAALFSLYRRMGYTAFGGKQEFTCTAALPVAQLQAISAEKYAALRAAYLPEGGVVQQGVSLAFLQTQARFYAGKDFILTAAVTAEGLTVFELLGPGSAPHILSALGAEKGRFRIPGEAPFAMYRSLDGTPAPTYFGLALD